MKFKKILLSIGVVTFAATAFGSETLPKNPNKFSLQNTNELFTELEPKNVEPQQYSNVYVDEACATVILSCGWSTYRCESSVMSLIAFALRAEDAICGGEMGEK